MIEKSFLKNVVLAPYTTFKIGGPADYFLEADTTEKLVDAVRFARSLGMRFFILGGGSNILVGDKGIRGLVIKNATRRIAITGLKGKITQGKSTGSVFVQADSGAPFNLLVRFTLERALSGFEMHLGLPGTVGGAIYMNSKWMHPPSYVGDAVYQAELLNAKSERITVPREYFQFQYGRSVLQKTGDILLSVTFRLSRGEKQTLWRIADQSIAYRNQTQPQGEKTAGCAFKNISDADALLFRTPNNTTSAGYLIDHAGCKDWSVHGARISPKHANFIVNTGNATATDVIQLLDTVKKRVQEQFGVTLVEEILRVGEF